LKVSFNWLKEYVDFTGRESLVPSLLNSRTMEVEKIIAYSEKKSLKNIIVGEVKEIKPHPTSHNFNIAIVYAGKDAGQKTIVYTKAKAELNIGDKPLLAIKGAIFDDGLKIREKSILGVVSEGAFCSEKELGFSLNIPNILKFPDEPVGKSAYDIFELNDTVLEFDLEPNRPDLFGIQGFAYEMSSIFDKDINLPEIDKGIEFKIGSSYSSKPEELTVTMSNPEAVPCYIAVQIDDIVIKESDLEIKNKLIKSGLRPINNIVDLTNLVMLETAQPLHAFDRNKLSGNKIFPRFNKKNEDTIVTIDSKERKLFDDSIIIADGDKIVALGGIMGSISSAIEAKTNSIVVESANFNMSNIRRTSRLMALRTDASTRFEKGLSPIAAINAMKRIVYLIKKNIPEAKVSCYSYYITDIAKPKEFFIYFNELFNFLGQSIDKNKVIKILSRLGFKSRLSEIEDGIFVAAPYFRSDILGAIDIYEEIFRIYGYDKVKSTMPMSILNYPEVNINYQTSKEIKEILSHAGITEIITPSFTGDKELEIISENLNNALELKNPISVEFNYLRTSLIPDSLKILEQNLKKYKDIKIYEIGKIYYSKDNDDNKKYADNYPVVEKNRLCGAFCSGIKLQSEDTEFYRIKGVVEFLFSNLGIKKYHFLQPKEHNIFDTNRTLEIFIGRDSAGFLGEIKTDIVKEFGLEFRVGVFDIDFEVIKEFVSHKKTFTAPSKYPIIEQDISIIASIDLEYGEIEKFIKKFSELVKNIVLIDIYRGKQIEKGKIAYLIRYDASDDSRTLTMKEVNELRDRLVTQLNKNFGIVLRG
jgi:phenylalanyl-tRNA synthetase beta chain